MVMGTERSSKPLHNFPMPCLKWGSQRFLRCMKVNSNGGVVAVDRRSSAASASAAACEVHPIFINSNRRRHRDSEIDRPGSNYHNRIGLGHGDSFKLSPPPAGIEGSGPKTKPDSDRDDGIEAVRAKLMFDLQTAADKMKDAILRERLEKEEEDPPPPAVPPASEPSQAEAEAVRPWNLRTRRAACKDPNGRISGSGAGAGGSNGFGGNNLKLDVLKPNSSPVGTEIKSPRLRGGAAAAAASPSGEKRERAKFSVSLSRREIEEDFVSILGQRPPRRPKKRAKYVQKQLDTLFPGLWLTEVNADLYKVPDATETGKR